MKIITLIKFFNLILLIIENVVRGGCYLGDDGLEPIHHFLHCQCGGHYLLDERFGDYSGVGGDV